MARDIEEKMVFGIAVDEKDGVPVLVLGVTKGAWEYMRNGQTHTFDLRRLGMPVKAIVFGAEDHATAMKLLEESAKAGGSPILDLRNQDFGIKPGGG